MGPGGAGRRSAAFFAGFAAVLWLWSGCGTRQAVTATDTAAPPAGGAVTTEPVKPEAAEGKPAEAAVTETAVTGTQTAMAGIPSEAAAGVVATQERPSRFDDILFDYDQYFIREDAKPTLAQVADYLKARPGASILVEGHCDERGTPEYNLALGERRAESTRNYLVSLGVPAKALSTVSFGEEKPADPGHTEEAWAKNRRAHFVPK